jgi:hypothetical protein
MAEPNVVPVIWVSAFAYRDDLVDDGRLRIEVVQVFDDGSTADCAVVFLGEHLGAELAPAVSVLVAHVAPRRGPTHRKTGVTRWPGQRT